MFTCSVCSKEKGIFELKKGVCSWCRERYPEKTPVEATRKENTNKSPLLGIGKQKHLLETARRSIAHFHGLVAGETDTSIGQLLDCAEDVRAEMGLTKTATEMGASFDQFFENPFALSDQQIRGMLDWGRDAGSVFKEVRNLDYLAGLTVWLSNGSCAAHIELLPLGTALWRDLKRGRGATRHFEWDEYKVVLGQLGVEL